MPSRSAAGEVVAAAGDPSLTCFMRSSSKPLQALPLVRARDDLPDDELAIACASHHDTPEQVAAARALLARAEATEDDLELGLQEGRPPERIHNNCSGNHAGHARPLPRARLADAGLPPARASRPAGVPGDPRRGRRGRAGGARDRHRRLRHRHLRAHARADGARLLASRVAARRPESRGRDAGAAGPRRRPRRRRLSPHARCAGLAREGRSRGAPLRRRPRRDRRRAQDRGRREPRPRAGARGLPRRSARRSELARTFATSAPSPSITRGEQVGDIVDPRR